MNKSRGPEQGKKKQPKGHNSDDDYDLSDGEDPLLEREKKVIVKPKPVYRGEFSKAIEDILGIALAEKNWNPNPTEIKAHFLFKLDKDKNSKPLFHESGFKETASGNQLIIKRIQFYKNPSKGGDGCGVIVFSPDNKELSDKLIIYLNHEAASAIETIMRDKLNASCFHSHARAGKDALNWSVKYDARYAFNEANAQVVYDKLHARILSMIRGKLDKLAKLAKKNNEKIKLNVIDGGCGKSSLLTDIMYAFDDLPKRSKDKLEIKVLGFDINQENVDYCNEKFRGGYIEAEAEVEGEGGEVLKKGLKKVDDPVDDPSENYIQGDILKIDETIGQAKSNDQLYSTVNPPEDEKNIHANDKIVTLFITSGSMTRLVLNNSFECIRSLQSAYHAGLDEIIVTGISEVLFNPHIIRKTGFIIKETIDVLKNKASPIYILVPQTFDKILNYTVDRFMKKDCPALDLSMSSCLLRILKNLGENYKKLVEVLDISCCRIQDFMENKSYDELIAILKNEYPNLKTITFDYYPDKGEDAFLEKLGELKTNEIKQIKLDIKKLSGKEENYTMSANARRLLSASAGFFKEKYETIPKESAAKTNPNHPNRM